MPIILCTGYGEMVSADNTKEVGKTWASFTPYFLREQTHSSS